MGEVGCPPVEFRLLGAVTAVAGGTELRLGGSRQRALLALLLLDPAAPVSGDRLADELWCGAPPTGAATTIRSYVSRLRSVIGADSIHSSSAGYRLLVAPEQIDARCFERLFEDGRHALADGSPGRASQLLQEALALWRGEHALADVGDCPALAVEARRLDELRLMCIEERVEADLALGGGITLATELRARVEQAPLRERLWCQLAIALYRGGQRADALAALREAREVLAQELGLEPGEELRRTELAILRGEQAVAPQPEQSAVPASTTSFVGREGELSDLDQLLRRHRLVTVTGLGGSGKTRLAAEQARQQQFRWAGGVWWVDLTAVADPALVPAAVAEVLGVADRSSDPVIEALLDSLRRKEALLVIDNCEHLATGCAQLVDSVLRGCPNVHVLATSRMSLGVPGEHEYPLDPLPADDADRARSPAVQLFLDRAAAVGRHLPDDDAASRALIGRVCRELDGLPLAIELAAARTRSLSLPEIAARLGDRFRFLRSSHRVGPLRHRTLATAMDWSYDLLAPAEQQLLRRLSVFAGGATLTAAAEVCVDGDDDAALELLARLIRASVLHAEHGEPTRYRLLETVRDYAADKLAHDDDADAVRRRHAEYFLRLAEESNLSLDALGHGPQQHEPVLREQHNLRAALDWAIECDVLTAARLGLALENFWVTQALAEGERRLAQILARAADLDLVLRARLTRDHASCLDALQDYARARPEYRCSRELFVLADDRVGVATLDYRLGIMALRQDGDIDTARRLWRTSLDVFRAEQNPIGELQALGNLGQLELDDGNVEVGRQMIETSVEMARAAGWWWWAARGEGQLGAAAAAAGRADEAWRHAREFLAFAWRSGNRQETLHALAILARAAAHRGEDDLALTLWSTVAASEDGPGRFGRFDRAAYAASMPPGDLPRPLPVGQAVELALRR
jgi:predicted ATPase/DNA-binding SARP family transcriptional activator